LGGPDFARAEPFGFSADCGEIDSGSPNQGPFPLHRVRHSQINRINDTHQTIDLIEHQGARLFNLQLDGHA